MGDVFSRAKRSEVMSKIRSKWTTPERKIHGFLKSKKIEHKMHPKLVGNPDIFLPEENLVVFVQGCFWHKCPKHYREPKTRRFYWIPKIKRNVSRDREVTKALKKKGYRVIRIWEHQVKDGSFKKILREKLKKR
jgi:DNA mismatch endonuclease (patch repair protein)